MPAIAVCAIIRALRKMKGRMNMCNIMDKMIRRKARRIKRSERFKDFQIEFIPIPHDPMCDMIFDIPMWTIYINTAADPSANIARLGW